MHQDRNWVPCGAHLSRLSSNQAQNRCRKQHSSFLFSFGCVHACVMGEETAAVLITSRLTPEGWDVCWCPDLIFTPIITSRGSMLWHYGGTEWARMGRNWRLTLEGYRTPEKSLMMRGWVPSDWCLVSAARLNQYHLMRCPMALRCASTQSMFYLSFPSPCVSKLIGQDCLSFIDPSSRIAVVGGWQVKVPFFFTEGLDHRISYKL